MKVKLMILSNQRLTEANPPQVDQSMNNRTNDVKKVFTKFKII